MAINVPYAVGYRLSAFGYLLLDMPNEPKRSSGAGFPNSATTVIATP